MSPFEAIKKRLFHTFARLNDVFQTETRTEFDITDFEGQSYLILESDETHFTVLINHELKTYPRNDTAWTAIEVAFLEKYGIPLFEKREKICK